jgi:hypothetical protein
LSWIKSQRNLQQVIHRVSCIIKTNKLVTSNSKEIMIFH